MNKKKKFLIFFIIKSDFINGIYVHRPTMQVPVICTYSFALIQVISIQFLAK